MKIVITLFIFALSTNAFAVQRSAYPTKIVRERMWGGAPWASASNKREVVQGPCEEMGMVEDELTCYNAAKENGFEYYQITTRNHWKEYNGTLWDKTSYDYLGCFICH